MDADLELLEASLGYCFRDRELLSRALTHRSRAFENGSAAERPADNEQLEFLGDSVLGFLVSEELVKRYPAFPEGRLSKLKAYLVSANHLHKVAANLDLGAHLLLGRGEELSGGRAKRAVLADAVEAVLAAIYLDAGLHQARRFVERHVVGEFDPLQEEGGDLVTDFKGALQDMARLMNLPSPHYIIVSESGPEHSKTFTIEVRVGADCVGRAEGRSKKNAGQKAAQMALKQLTGER